MLLEIIDDTSVNARADLNYKASCMVNKTGVDFEF